MASLEKRIENLRRALTTYDKPPAVTRIEIFGERDEGGEELLEVWVYNPETKAFEVEYAEPA